MKARFNPWLLILMAVPLCLTVMAWWLVSQNQFQSVQAEFNHLSSASEKALHHRMESYVQALLGGKGFFLGSNKVSREEWRQYALALNIEENFPGINGIGVINKVDDQDLNHYIEQVRAAGNSQFSPKPIGDFSGHYIINYIEPIEINQEAVGLNIAYEQNRLQAADLAMETRQAAITRRILLVQDAEKTPGFLLLLPVSRSTINLQGHDRSTPSWIYAPFIAKNFLAHLTNGQGIDFRLQVYDASIGDENIIFDSHFNNIVQEPSLFVVEKEVEVMQQKWLVRWSSTQVFEANHLGHGSFYIVLFGLFFTILFALFISLSSTQIFNYQVKHTSRNIQKVNPFFAISLFLLLSTGSFVLYDQLVQKELEQVNAHALKQQATLEGAIKDKIETVSNRFNNAAQEWYREGFSVPVAKEKWYESVVAYHSDVSGLSSLFYLNDALELQSSIEITERFENSSEHFKKSIIALIKNHIKKTPKAIFVSDPMFFEHNTFFVTVHPVLQNKLVLGYFVAQYELKKVLNPTLKRLKVPDQYGLGISVGERVISFGGQPTEPLYNGVTVLDGNKWATHFWVQKQHITNMTSFLPIFVFFIGFIASMLMSMVVYFSQKVRMNSRVLADKENVLSTFVSNIPMSLAMFDPSFRYLTASERWFQLYGLDKQRIIGQPHPSPSSALWLNQSLPQDTDDIVTVEESIHHADGSLKAWMRYRICQWFNNDGTLGGVVVFAEDVTEDKNMALLKNEFVSTVSHELRTPLTAIQGALGLLKMGVSTHLESKYQKLLSMSFDNCQHLTTIINDILDLEKIAAGKLSYELKDIELNELARQVVNLNGPYAEKYQVNVEIRSNIKILLIHADHTRLTQCLVNLLSNAAKFSHKSGVVYLCLDMVGNQAQIEVQDFGVGIPLAFQSKMFKRFAQADASSQRAKGGTGLGLAITKQMIEDMNGSIDFTSAVDQGSTFTILFPLNSRAQHMKEAADKGQ